MAGLSRFVFYALLALGFAALPIHRAEAVDNKGLSISPVREYIDIKAGQYQNKSLLLANNTDRKLRINMSVDQFLVENYTYDFVFKEDHKNWIKFEKTAVDLDPNQVQELIYAISVPKDAPPGGHYFTIFGAADIIDGDAKSTVRVATAVYIKVAGELQLAGNITKSSLPWVNFGNNILYSYDINNTGNTHFFGYVSELLTGFGANNSTSEAAHILMPKTVRTIRRTIPAPPLPGWYKIRYGYRTDYGTNVYRYVYFVNIPIWSVLVLLGGVIAGRAVVLARRH